MLKRAGCRTWPPGAMMLLGSRECGLEARIVAERVEEGIAAERHVVLQGAALANAQGESQRVDDAAGERILELEDVAPQDVLGERPAHLAARHLDQLRGDPTLVSRGQDGAHQHRVHLEVARQLLEIRHGGREARRAQRRAHHQRFDARERHRDRIRQARAQELALGVGAQQAERQHREPHQRRLEDRASRGVRRRLHGSQLARQLRGARRTPLALLLERARQGTRSVTASRARAEATAFRLRQLHGDEQPPWSSPIS